MRAPETVVLARDREPDEFNRPVPISYFLTLRVEDRARVMVWP
jgi:hypothetical protein